MKTRRFRFASALGVGTLACNTCMCVVVFRASMPVEDPEGPTRRAPMAVTWPQPLPEIATRGAKGGKTWYAYNEGQEQRAGLARRAAARTVLRACFCCADALRYGTRRFRAAGKDGRSDLETEGRRIARQCRESPPPAGG